MEENGILQTFRAIRKYSRWFAGFWFLVAGIMLLKGIVDIFSDPGNAESWGPLLAAAGISTLAYVFWKTPDWMINRYQTQLSQARQDPDEEIQLKKAEICQAVFEHIEISNKKTKEKFLQEDRYGRAVFDSTTRPLRLMFGGSFLIIGLIIGGLIFAFSDDTGFFEYFFVGGWVLFCLITMGYVYEVVIDKSTGTAERTAGWFFIVLRKQFYLMDFSRVVVESSFYRQRYDTLRDQYRSEDPTFRVNLSGKKELNLRVFSYLSDARALAQELAGYLQLPLEERTDIRI
jgi:hypothetical protein